MLQQRQKKDTHIHAWYINTDYRNKHIHTYAHTHNKHAYKYTDYYHNTCFNVVKWIKLCYFPSLNVAEYFNDYKQHTNTFKKRKNSVQLLSHVIGSKFRFLTHVAL